MKKGRAALVVLAACAAFACRLASPAAARYDPSRDLGALFQAVQLSGMFADSKTFVDARPLLPPAELAARYASARDSAGFSLRAFVAQDFEVPREVGADVRTDLVRGMLDNFAYLVKTVGHVPNGNRTYYLSRSQPPFFAAMVGLYAAATDTTQALRYLDALEAEHAFWMTGAERLGPGEAYRRVVRLVDGSLLNRYWDDRAEPRPESYRPDYELAQTVPEGQRDALYRNLRATAESGWDFSSRWMRDPKDLRTLETTQLVPVDLNSLLYHAEVTITALRRVRGRPGDREVAERFARAAQDRRRALLGAAYDPATGYFYDVRWQSGARVADRPTIAAAAPLYFGLATPEQGRAVGARLQRDFLKPGGFVPTLIASGQQWDAPNGWPPLEWLAIEGVRRYGRTDLATRARDRWLALNRRTYQATGKMTEKYDVVDLRRRAGGGEYPTQDGFGWTNGVALALEGTT